jgi:hypothetical protein
VLTDSGILLDLDDRARLPLISTENSSRVRSPPLTSGNVISPIADGNSNMVQPGSFHRLKITFGDPCVPVVHEFGMCSIEILKPRARTMRPPTGRECALRTGKTSTRRPHWDYSFPRISSVLPMAGGTQMNPRSKLTATNCIGETERHTSSTSHPLKRLRIRL